MAKKKARMGRPPLGVRATNVRLTEDQHSRIEAIAGAQGKAKYIRDAVEEKLARDEKGSLSTR